MRSLIILLFLTSVRGYDLPINNGVVNFDLLNNNLVIINLTRNDGINMVNTFFTRSKSSTPHSPFMFENCGDNKMRLKYAFTETTVAVGPDKDTIIITRLLDDPADELLDCFQLTTDMQWFGGPQHHYQHWPVQNMRYEEETYLPTHHLNMAITERYWLSSKGIYIYVNETTPLFLDQNNYRDKHLCMISKNKAPYRHRQVIEVTYTMGVFSDPKTAHQYAVKNHLNKPQAHPDEQMTRYPIWSTWARYKDNINETVVETFADEIVEHNFKHSQIEIDDNWESCYGSAEFDSDKFPNASAFVQRLKDKGFRVTLWVHPFINRDCEPSYTLAMDKDYFVKNLEGDVQTSWWWGSDAGTIDFTNPVAATWWIGRLFLLKKLGIDSFKFDAGEVSWLPEISELNDSPELQPALNTQEYVRLPAVNFGNGILVRVGWHTQRLPIFVHMIDKNTGWTWNNGLPTLITTLLQMNLNGYVFVLPDMVGSSNGYQNDTLDKTEYPSKEMFIRWLQASVFMPSLQFSFAPWDFDDETINLCREYTELHDSYVANIVTAMQQAIDNGTPVNPPIWWIDPTDITAHKINDEYLLGESILVAPVIEEGAESRNIYLPKGTWYDTTRKASYTGPTWLKNYPAPLAVLPYFRKIEMTVNITKDI